MKCTNKTKQLCFNGLLIGALLLLSFNTAQAATGETVTYYHNDLLGSPVAATDDAGAVLWREQYQPYGKKLLKEPASRTSKVDYTGHLYDKDLGLVYAGARYYDPDLGRFMSMDPVGFQEGNVHSFNKYAYANNNPYGYVDPNGESGISNFYLGKGDMQGILSGQLDQDFFEARAEAYVTAATIYGGPEIVGAKIFSGVVNAIKNAKWLKRSSGAASGAKLLANYSRTAKLSQKRLEHIVERHWHSSGAKGAGKFLKKVGLKDLRSMINEAVLKGGVRSNTKGRPGNIFEYDFGSSIGKNIGGKATSRLRVVVGKNGDVVTAFPF